MNEDGDGKPSLRAPQDQELSEQGEDFLSKDENDHENEYEHQPPLLSCDYKTYSLEGMGLKRQRSYSYSYKKPSLRRNQSHGGAVLAQDASTDVYSYYTHHSPRHLDGCGEMETLLVIPPRSSVPRVPVQDYGGLKDGYDTRNLYEKDLGTNNITNSDAVDGSVKKRAKEFMYYLAYALINATMSVPCLYGYASVIFSHPFFQPNMASLSKLVIWSSAIHQFAFVAFSSLGFAKAEVQDAGLIFLSSMGVQIADSILEAGEGGESIEVEIISTTIVAIGLATASLGVVLVCMGRFHCANAVSYLPLPVVGGYLAYIGYFCLVAGVGLCISKNMADTSFFRGIEILMNKKSFLLALPGLLSGCLLMIVARFAKSEVALPGTMVAIPLAFYGVMYVCGLSMDEMREEKWVGETQPPAPVTALLDLIDFSKVRWEVILNSKILSTWLGMVFVVSFSSCLDVAAISIDMGQPLDVNKELTTVGLSNIISGLLFGQSGSYIFSQTIFTYRTGYHSRWVGFLGALCFLSLVLSKVNLLEISPLFFLGSTLIFIGFDLLYEWLLEVRHKLLLSEYVVLLATFFAIQVVGINGGIIFGILVAVVDYVVTTAKISSLRRVMKRSKLAWQPDQRKLLQDIYDSPSPKIVTLEVKESIFFGSSLQLLTNICDEISINASPTDIMETSITSPRYHGGLTPKTGQSSKGYRRIQRQCPKFVVLDLTAVPNVDASAARGCFLQLSKMCQQHGIVLCASGANPRVDWILRSHNVAHAFEDEVKVKELLLTSVGDESTKSANNGMVLLFDNTYEALELCENNLIQNMESNIASSDQTRTGPQCGMTPSLNNLSLGRQTGKTSLSTIFSRILGMQNDKNNYLLLGFDNLPQIEEITLFSGDNVFVSDTVSDAFYVVLAGCICIFHEGDDEDSDKSEVLISGAGSTIPKSSSRLDLNAVEKLGNIVSFVNVGGIFGFVDFKLDLNAVEKLGNIVSFVNVGGIFGFVDFKLDRRRSFSAASSRDNTIIAKISHTTVDHLKENNSTLHHMIERVLLQASLMELANLEVT